MSRRAPGRHRAPSFPDPTRRTTAERSRRVGCEEGVGLGFFPAKGRCEARRTPPYGATERRRSSDSRRRVRLIRTADGHAARLLGGGQGHGREGVRDGRLGARRGATHERGPLGTRRLGVAGDGARRGRRHRHGHGRHRRL